MFKQYINELMRDKRNGPFDKVVKTALYGASLLYGFLIALWDACYSIGIFKVHKVPLKVVSVGNITVGGTGKTPFVAFLAHKLKRSGKRISILTRGYGDDEWRMLEEKVTSLPVVVGRDRVKSARKAEELYKSDILLLDDGYQHRRLNRDLDILLIDAANPFGNGHMLPRGILREPLGAIKHADIVVLTKADFGKENVATLRHMVSKRFKKYKILESRYKAVGFTDIASGAAYGTDFICGKKISVFSGIADSSYFKQILKGLGGILTREFDYGDHSAYTEKDIKYVNIESERLGCELIIVTEKDGIKLSRLNSKSDLRILILHIEVEITNGMEELVDTISGLDRCNSG